MATVHVKVAGAWKIVSSVWVKVSGAWKQIYASLSAALTGTPYEAVEPTVFPNDTTVGIIAELTITGTGPFTYLWEYTGGAVDTSSPTAASFSISYTGRLPAARSGTVWCTVSDNYGNSLTTPAEPWSLTLI